MKNYIAISLMVICHFLNVSHADTLLIQEVNKVSNITVPTRGLNMSQVISKFGEPKLKKDAVGEPPITQWQYEDFSVYFERQWVIQAVILKKKEDS